EIANPWQSRQAGGLGWCAGCPARRFPRCAACAARGEEATASGCLELPDKRSGGVAQAVAAGRPVYDECNESCKPAPLRLIGRKMRCTAGGNESPAPVRPPAQPEAILTPRSTRRHERLSRPPPAGPRIAG